MNIPEVLVSRSVVMLVEKIISRISGKGRKVDMIKKIFRIRNRFIKFVYLIGFALLGEKEMDYSKNAKTFRF